MKIIKYIEKKKPTIEKVLIAHKVAHPKYVPLSATAAAVNTQETPK